MFASQIALIGNKQYGLQGFFDAENPGFEKPPWKIN
jgi:hypothetical protein